MISIYDIALDMVYPKCISFFKELNFSNNTSVMLFNMKLTELTYLKTSMNSNGILYSNWSKLLHF